MAVRAYTRYPDRVSALVLSAGLAVTSSRVRLASECADDWAHLTTRFLADVLG